MKYTNPVSKIPYYNDCHPSVRLRESITLQERKLQLLRHPNIAELTDACVDDLVRYEIISFDEVWAKLLRLSFTAAIPDNYDFARLSATIYLTLPYEAHMSIINDSSYCDAEALYSTIIAQHRFVRISLRLNSELPAEAIQTLETLGKIKWEIPSNRPYKTISCEV